MMVFCNGILFLLVLCLIGLASAAIDEFDLMNLSTNEEEIARFLSSADDEEEDQGGSYGQRCGNRNQCLKGLECQTLNLALGNRCLPDPACLQASLTAFEARHDMEAYKALVLERAGVSEKEIMTLYQQSASRESFVELKTVRALMASLPTVLAAPAQELWEIARQCARILPTADSELGTIYLGIQIEAGAWMDGMFQYLQTDAGDSFFRGCLGPELGAGADLSFLFGGSLGRSDDLLCFSLMFDLDVGLGLNLGTTGGIQANGWPYIEISAGAGLGIGAGINACGAGRLT